MHTFIDTSFFMNEGSSSLEELVARHHAALGYVDYIHPDARIQVIKHLNAAGSKMTGGIKYTGFKGRNSFGYIPFKTLRFIKKEDPDLVIMQGLVFPLQAIALKKIACKKAILLVQHHGEKPFTGIKKWLQKLADRYITGYLFTSLDNAKEWIDEKIIKSQSKCFELLEASSNFKKLNKKDSRQKLQMEGDNNFLWVGRLNKGKDPLCVIRAFEQYISSHPDARLYMVFQTAELLPDIDKIINENRALKDRLILKGSLPHQDLEDWFNAADFYISGSHREGSGYALLEAMACGCIPVVTDIPTFKKITDNGSLGFLYQPGNSGDLLQTLIGLDIIEREKTADSIVKHFQKNLSFKAIADELIVIYHKLQSK
jgi:glycosyltransferase involved in cell wall biosynthesis